MRLSRYHEFNRPSLHLVIGSSGMLDGPTSVFVLKYAHQHVALPLAADNDALAYFTFANEAAFFIAGNRPFVESKYTQVHAMKLQFLESELQDQSGCFSSLNGRGQRAKRAGPKIRFKPIVRPLPEYYESHATPSLMPLVVAAEPDSDFARARSVSPV
jgi:hypothetical protein